MGNYSDIISFEDFFNEIEVYFSPIEKIFDTNADSLESSNLFLEDVKYLENREKLIEECNKFLLNLFYKINIRILDGSYIQDSLKEEIEFVKNEIVEINTVFEIIFKSSKNDKIFESFKNDLAKAKNGLNYLEKLIGNILYKDDKIEFSLYTSFSESFENNIKKNIWSINSIELLSFNIYLIKADHFLSVEDFELLKNLEIIYLGSKVLTLYPFTVVDYINITQLLYIKSNFLRKKVLLRNAEEIISTTNNNIHSNRLFIQSKNDYAEFSAERIANAPSLGSLKYWIVYSISHYELIEKSYISIERNAKKISIDFNSDKVSFLDLHLMIKYNKDIYSGESFESAFDNLKEIKNYLKNKLALAAENSFDEYCLITNTTYCFNNILSLLEENQKGDELLDIYNELINISRLKSRSNYFAKGTLLKHYSNVLKIIFEKDSIDKDLETIKQILEICKKLVKEFNDDLRWFKQHNNYIFILPKVEATVEINNFNLYIYSSFVLPTSSNYLINKFNNSLNDIQFFQTTLKSILSLRGSLEKITKLEQVFEVLNLSFKKTNKQFQEKENRTLEIAAIITSIMTFVAGSIPGFKFINTGLEAIYFSLALGTSLVLFSLVFFTMMSTRSKKSKQYKKYIIICLFLVIAFWILLFFISSNKLDYKEEDPNKIKIENTIDLKHQNNALNIDSLNIQN